MRYLLVLLILSFNSFSNAQQVVSNLELKAHYPLNWSGIDTTGKNDSMQLNSPVFSNGGILSPGCYIYGSIIDPTCLIQTPKINALYDSLIYIQVDFNVSKFAGPIIMMVSRYIGVGTNYDGSIHLWTHSNEKDTIHNSFIEKEKWYELGILYNNIDTIINVYLDKQRLFTKKKHIDLSSTQAKLTNSNFANGRAYHGYWKDLLIYSTNQSTAIDAPPIKSDSIYIYPNPSQSILYVKYAPKENITYKIISLEGKVVKQSILHEPIIDIHSLIPGQYIIDFYRDNKRMTARKFVKL